MTTKRSLEIRLCHVGSTFAAIAATLVVLGVGCSDKASNKGTVSTDIHGTDAGWSDVAVPEEISDTQACARYMRAVCERKNECGLATDDCGKAVTNCPDSLFSTGSTRDSKTTWQCAFEMRQRSCKDVYLSVNPTCVTPGTRKPGETCVSSAQCESLACTGSGSSCGACLKRVGKDQPCTDATSVVCERGLTCDPTAGTCVALADRNFDDVVSTGLEVGKPCDLRNVCAADAYCKYDADGKGLCTPRIAEQEPCLASESCVRGTYCFQEGAKCRKLPTISEKCGNDIATGNATWCTDDAYCDQNTGYMCRALPLAGEPCASTLLSGGPIVCAPSARCDTATEPRVCVALALAGEACTNDESCAVGLQCLCPDASCSEKKCGIMRDVAESCAVPGDYCNSVSTCSDGVCKANPSQSLYKSLCGG